MSGLLVVEWVETSPGQLADYHAWYDHVHLREITSLPGFTSARRLGEAGPGGRCLAVYEVDGDVEAAKAALKAFMRSGEMTMPPEPLPSPPPAMTWFDTASTVGT